MLLHIFMYVLLYTKEAGQITQLLKKKVYLILPQLLLLECPLNRGNSSTERQKFATSKLYWATVL